MYKIKDEPLELLEEIMIKITEATEEVKNGIYDPMLECASIYKQL